MGCFGFLKTMMFVFNGVIFLAGAGVLGVGIWVKVDGASFTKLLDTVSPDLSQVVNVGYLCIAVGLVLLVMGFLGCCGAIKESKCMLLLFFIIVLLILVAQVAGAVVVLVFSSLADVIVAQIGNVAKDSLEKDFGKQADITTVWNTTMEQLECCGFNNYTDFDNSPFKNYTKHYPSQCCKKTEPCTEAEAKTSQIAGCYNAILNFLKDNSKILGAVTLGIGGLEIAAMVVSMVLYCQIDSK
ncbi:tetraspanin-1-like [Acipenser ruthenus]|uniref:tetraspanin-1-like n=1 Tax=Acipenser ruthenus TaxID=7906 RepID=UPI00274134B8|nr:tetraspanin-1-like [Acipenser ruthenus]